MRTQINRPQTSQVTGHPKSSLLRGKRLKYQKGAHPTVLTHGEVLEVKKQLFCEEKLNKKELICEEKVKVSNRTRI